MYDREHEPCPIGSDRALDSALITTPEARDPALIFVVAVLCFLACLTALMVIAGAAGDDRGTLGFRGTFGGAWISAYQFSR